jgi:hypothetical protein
MDINALSELLRQQQLLVEDNLFLNGELLR